MRIILTMLVIGALMSTIGIYAAGLGGAPTIKSVGGTGDETVSSPTSSAVSIDWNFTGNQVSGGSVTWTPDGSTTYDVTLTAGGQTATMTTAVTTASFSRTDTLVFGSNIEASAVSTAKVTIKEN